MTGQHLDIQQIVSDPDLHAWVHVGRGTRLVVSFSGVGAAKDGSDLSYEFARTATNDGEGHALFIADPNRSWLNNPGLIEKIVELIDVTKKSLDATEVVTLGHSMGGFAAAVIPDFTPVSVAVCMSPQASVHPEVAHDDQRWMRYRDEIATFRIRSVVDHIVPNTKYFALFGQHYREKPQRSRFAEADNIDVLCFPRTVHNVPQRLKQQGIMDEVVWMAFRGSGRRLRKLLNERLDAYHRREDQIDRDHIPMGGAT